MLLSIPNFGSDFWDSKNEILKQRPFFMKKSGMWWESSMATLGCRFYFYKLSKRIFLPIYLSLNFREKCNIFIKKTAMWWELSIATLGCRFLLYNLSKRIFYPCLWAWILEMEKTLFFSWKNTAMWWVLSIATLGCRYFYPYIWAWILEKNTTFSWKKQPCDENYQWQL